MFGPLQGQNADMRRRNVGTVQANPMERLSITLLIAEIGADREPPHSGFSDAGSQG